MVASISNEHLPLPNRRSTILGSTIPFQIIASFAVILRIYARVRVVRSMGWDDLFVLLAFLSISVGSAFVYVSTNLGLGDNFFSIPQEELFHYLKVFYVANATYASSTGLIKISLLMQCLRLSSFATGPLRKICIVLLVVVSLWASAWIVMSWAPCFPVQAFWDWSIPNAKCYGFGTKTEKPFVATYVAQEASNAVLDMIVLLLPLWPYIRRTLTKREITAVTLLSCIGLACVSVAFAHLGLLVAHQAGWKPHLNLTYYAALPIIMACIEVNLAITAASIPIFWPVIEADLDQIFVTKEVTVTATHRRLQDNEVEMDNCSVHTTDSEAGLRRKESYNDYGNPFRFRQETDSLKGNGHAIQIETSTPPSHGRPSFSIPRRSFSA